MGSDDEDEAGQAFDVPEQAASHRERPWLCEELVQYVAAMPDPLPPWAQKIWEDFLHHVQEEQDALKFSSTSAATTSPPAVEVVDESMQEVKGRRKHAGSEGDSRTPQRGRPALRVEEGWRLLPAKATPWSNQEQSFFRFYEQSVAWKSVANWIRWWWVGDSAASCLNDLFRNLSKEQVGWVGARKHHLVCFAGSILKLAQSQLKKDPTSRKIWCVGITVK